MSYITEDDYTAEYDIRGKLTGEESRISQRTGITVSYLLADLDVTEYSFGQEFRARDTREYFGNMAYLSGNTVNNVIDTADRDLHFRRSGVSGRLLSLLRRIWPGRRIDADSTIVFHFALYTSKETASRKTGIRSPRIYFLLGKGGVIYPLFFDPYHEISPMSSDGGTRRN